MNSAEYQEYLKSDHWKSLRDSALERDGKRCVRCEWPVRLQVHHKIYRATPYDTLLEDLETLCERCHSGVHGKECKPRKIPQRVLERQAKDALKSPSELARIRAARREMFKKWARVNKWLVQGNRKEFKPRFRSIDTNKQNFAEPVSKPVRVTIPRSMKRYGAVRPRKPAQPYQVERRCKVCGQEHPLFEQLYEGKPWLMYRCAFGSEGSSPLRYAPVSDISADPF